MSGVIGAAGEQAREQVAAQPEGQRRCEYAQQCGREERQKGRERFAGGLRTVPSAPALIRPHRVQSAPCTLTGTAQGLADRVGRATGRTAVSLQEWRWLSPAGTARSPVA